MIWTAGDAKEIDRLSSEVYDVPSLGLMEEAGQASYRLALSLWKPYSRFLILAGAGNNGGDALVVARLLAEKGFDPIVIDGAFTEETSGRATQRLALDGICLLHKSLPDLLGVSLVVVDGLLGIGLKGPLREGETKTLLQKVAALKPEFVVAIDLPSGLDADVWEAKEPPLAATHTITFGALKAAHVANPAHKYCGEIRCDEIGFAADALRDVLARQEIPIEHFIHTPTLKSLWQHLPEDAHKYDRGHVLAIGGSPGKVGAILSSADAAWHSGAGWVSVAPLSDIMAPAWPKEFTYETFGIEGELDLAALMKFVEARKVRGLLIGPGTMQNPLTRDHLKLLCEIQKKSPLRLIFDAGALDKFLDLASGLSFQAENTLLTPHPGEWKRLTTNMPALNAVQDLGRARSLLLAIGVTAIFKSSTPIVLGPSGAKFLNKGDNRLARAGSGDRLAGIILGLSSSPLPIDQLAAIAQNLLADEKINLPGQ